MAMSEMIFSGLRDIRVSRLIIRLMASRLLPFKSGRRATIGSSSALAVLNARPSVARGLPSLLLDVASPTPLMQTAPGPPWSAVEYAPLTLVV